MKRIYNFPSYNMAWMVVVIYYNTVYVGSRGVAHTYCDRGPRRGQTPRAVQTKVNTIRPLHSAGLLESNWSRVKRNRE